jgi:hypothetical protein
MKAAHSAAFELGRPFRSQVRSQSASEFGFSYYQIVAAQEIEDEDENEDEDDATKGWS